MKIETRREMAMRRKRQRRSAFLGIAAIFLLVLILGITLFIKKQSLSAQNASYEAQKTELTNQLNEQKKRKEELNEYKKYIQTKKFVEEVAKNKFGLIYPDELILKSKN